MKYKVLATAAMLLALIVTATAQKKKAGAKGQPKLTVVQVTEQPPQIIVVHPPKPTNGSLFTDSSVNANLLRDFKARQTGDLVFIDVVESSTANVSSNAKRDRDSGNLGGLVPLVAGLPVNGAAVVAPVMGELGKREFEGKGSTSRTSLVRSRITARVLEVLPNGDLRIEAVKMVKINKETEQLAVTGIVRQNDLANDNSIPTTLVGDLRVEFNGKGIASADNGPGWLWRLFDKINPF
ncbi:MAG: flagellar basal body L-ring protein FlgH [Pyrinomonadaceae bacterium]